MDPRTREQFNKDVQAEMQDFNGLKRQLESPSPLAHQVKRHKWGNEEQEATLTGETGRRTPYPAVKSEPGSPRLPDHVVSAGLEEWIDRSVHELVANIKERVQDTISQTLQNAWGDA